jgi:iron complex transport system substrate-binding protein
LVLLKRLLVLVLFASLAFPARLVSLAPSITETVFLVGGERQLVGVTRYCDYPEAAKKLPRVGGYNDVNEERLLTLKPDIVLLLKTHLPLIAFCRKHHLKYEAFDSESIEGIRHMVKRVGAIAGQEKKALAWLSKHPRHSWKLEAKKQSVLVILEQVHRNGRIEAAYVLGQESFYHSVLSAAGLYSLFKGVQRYPLIGREGLSGFSPDKVIVLERGAPAAYKGVFSRRTKIYFLPQEVMKRPGPRYDQILAAFTRVALE